LKFRAKSENELSTLSDDDLVAYLSAAREAGQDDQVRLATGIFVFQRIEILKSRARVKMGDDQDVEEVVQDTIEGTLRAAFRGESPGELFNLMDTILRRRIADFYKARERTPAFAGPDADGNDPLDQHADGEDLISGLVSRVVLEEELGRCSDRDRMVVEMKVAGHSSQDVAEEVSRSGLGGAGGMTQANVDQIFSRFRKQLRGPLLGSEPSPKPPPDEPGQGIQA
jgi:DNA-directed RNA polymerase specialized sigma24 family protein